MDITEINELIRTLDTFINIAKYIRNQLLNTEIR